MKIKNIFKKSEKTVAKANVQKLEKNQLEKVVGGLVATPVTVQQQKHLMVIQWRSRRFLIL